MTKSEIEATAALDRFFAVVRQEASDNPKFAAALLEALGATVVFRGTGAVVAVDPVQVAIEGQEEFRKTFLSFSAADLKKLVKEYNLATPSDLTGKTRPPQIVDVMWVGAEAKIHDRGLRRR